MAWWTRSRTVEPGGGALSSGFSVLSAASASWSASKSVSWVSFFLGFFFEAGASTASLPKRYFVRSATGSRRAFAFHLDDARALLQVDAEALGDLAGGVEL